MPRARHTSIGTQAPVPSDTVSVKRKRSAHDPSCRSGPSSRTNDVAQGCIIVVDQDPSYPTIQQSIAATDTNSLIRQLQRTCYSGRKTHISTPTLVGYLERSARIKGQLDSVSECASGVKPIQLWGSGERKAYREMQQRLLHSAFAVHLKLFENIVREDPTLSLPWQDFQAAVKDAEDSEAVDPSAASAILDNVENIQAFLHQDPRDWVQDLPEKDENVGVVVSSTTPDTALEGQSMADPSPGGEMATESDQTGDTDDSAHQPPSEDRSDNDTRRTAFLQTMFQRQVQQFSNSFWTTLRSRDMRGLVRDQMDRVKNSQMTGDHEQTCVLALDKLCELQGHFERYQLHDLLDEASRQHIGETSAMTIQSIRDLTDELFVQHIHPYSELSAVHAHCRRFQERLIELKSGTLEDLGAARAFAEALSKHMATLCSTTAGYLRHTALSEAPSEATRAVAVRALQASVADLQRHVLRAREAQFAVQRHSKQQQRKKLRLPLDG